jgi:ATP-binding cassette subfamily C protein LapB
LAVSERGKLPFHQIEPALEQIGMRGHPLERKLRGWPPRKLPAILELTGERAVVLLEFREADALVAVPGRSEPLWVPAAELKPVFTGRAVMVEPDPTKERESERPWETARRTHWFWSEVWKVRREFWPILLAALVINLLALAVPLFTMNVYDRVIPNGCSHLMGARCWSVSRANFGLRTQDCEVAAGR